MVCPPPPYHLLPSSRQLTTQLEPREFNVVSAVKAVNREKNRSTDFLPMESGRVHLTPKPGGFFIFHYLHVISNIFTV